MNREMDTHSPFYVSVTINSILLFPYFIIRSYLTPFFTDIVPFPLPFRIFFTLPDDEDGVTVEIFFDPIDPKLITGQLKSRF